MLKETKKSNVFECIEVCSTELSSSRRVTIATTQENAEQIHVYWYLTHWIPPLTLQTNILKFICRLLKGDLH